MDIKSLNELKVGDLVVIRMSKRGYFFMHDVAIVIGQTKEKRYENPTSFLIISHDKRIMGLTDIAIQYGHYRVEKI